MINSLVAIKSAKNDIRISNKSKRDYKNITEAVHTYIAKLGNCFKTNIIINTDIVINDLLEPIDYETAKQTTIFNRAKKLFNFIGKKIFINNGQEIVVNNADIKESVFKTNNNATQKELIIENIAVFRYLDKIIVNGIKIATAPEMKNREKYSDWEYYVTPVEINAIKYIVEFDTVIDSNDNKRHFRLERIYKLGNKKITSLSDSLPSNYSDNVSNVTANNINPND